MMIRPNEKVLKLIEILADGEFHSGEDLAVEFNMTRAGINKYIKTLREWGISLSSVQGKGYCLDSSMNLLDKDKISSHYQLDNRLDVLPVIDSTNRYWLDRIRELNSGDTCVAEFQYQGRGRRGRQWFGPFGSNLYFSMYWRLEQGIAAAMGMSLIVGIVIAETLQKLSGKTVKVKWPNDLYLDDKKLAGILVELSSKTGDCAHAVIGMGINLTMKNPDTNIVTQEWSNLGVVDRNLLVAEMIKVLKISLKTFEQSGLSPFIERWNNLDNFAHRPVKLLIGEKVIRGIAKGINEHGALLLDENGTIKTYVGGEISLRADV